MNILLLYPRFPSTTYWSYSKALRFIGKKASMPPLGLITVASLIPRKHQLKLIDLNIETLKPKDILWADMVFTSSMIVQKESLNQSINEIHKYGKKIVAGGPYPTQYFQEISKVDHFVLGEAESGVLDQFFKDLENGTLKKVYARQVIRSYNKGKVIDEREIKALMEFFKADADIKVVGERPSMDASPLPRFDLLKINQYASMAIQISRGCPFNCEFCNEPTLFGHKVRLKSGQQIIKELLALNDLGFKGSLFVVDDNFIGNIRQIKEILPCLIDFQRSRDYPFSLYTEASINLAHDKELMELMRDAGFDMVFIGIETPNKEVLQSMNKYQNVKSDLLDDIKKIQEFGIEVTAGLIVGNDTDPESIGEEIFDFCQKSAIPTVMVGLLTAVKGSELYERLASEGRLLGDTEGNNTHSFEMNFLPPIGKNMAKIVTDYKNLLSKLYSSDGMYFFQRATKLIKNLGYHPKPARKIGALEIIAFLKSIFFQSLAPYRRHYWKLLKYTLLNKPKLFSEAIRLSILGHHYIHITRSAISAYRLQHYFQYKLNYFTEKISQMIKSKPMTSVEPRFELLQRIDAEKDKFLVAAREKIELLGKEYRGSLLKAYENISLSLDIKVDLLEKWLVLKTLIFNAYQSGKLNGEELFQKLISEKEEIQQKTRKKMEQLPANYRSTVEEFYETLSFLMNQILNDLRLENSTGNNNSKHH